MKGRRKKTDGLRTFRLEEPHGCESPGFLHYFSYIVNRAYQKPPTWTANKHRLQENLLPLDRGLEKEWPKSKKSFYSLYTRQIPMKKTIPQPHPALSCPPMELAGASRELIFHPMLQASIIKQQNFNSPTWWCEQN